MLSSLHRSVRSAMLMRLVLCAILLAVGGGFTSAAVQAAPRLTTRSNGLPSISPQSLIDSQVQAAGTTPLADLVAADGSLNLPAGFRGTVDPRGWRLASEAGQAPHFAPLAAPGDEYWSPAFAPAGPDNTVYAMAADGSGNVYVGGLFTSAGGVTVNRVAKWNGSYWSALGTGMEGMGDIVYALAVYGTSVYAGGFFTSAGGATANYIAQWNGSTWSSLGSGASNGTGDTVRALLVDGSGNLYVGGDFITAGGAPAKMVAKWNGSSWSALGTGMTDTVYALALDGSGNLYAGGQFTTAGGVSVNHIARWNGSWSALGAGTVGTNGNVYALAVSGSNIYAAGTFTTAGSASANNIAKWSGSGWSALGTGMNALVRALAMDGSGNLYAGGSFITAGGGEREPHGKMDREQLVLSWNWHG